MKPDQSGRSLSPAEDADVNGCDHPAAGLSAALLRDDAKYCARCSSLVMEDGTTEPVGITRITTAKR